MQESLGRRKMTPMKLRHISHGCHMRETRISHEEEVMPHERDVDVT